MTIAERLAERNISELLHFTTNRGIVGTLAKRELLSRFRLPKESYLSHILYVNAANRPEADTFFDKSDNWLDYVNLSISEINERYFKVSQRWHLNSDVWWGVLAFDPVIATHPNVVFATTNNAYDRCVRTQGLEGFEALFAPVIYRKRTDWKAWRSNRASCLTTCEQAEVLYPKGVPVEFLRRVYVREAEHHDAVSGWLVEFEIEGVEVLISPDKFAGKPN